MIKFNPSKYQKEIFNWTLNDTGNLVINAVAGSGKTTTLIEVAKMIDNEKSLFIAFNKHIVNHLKTKLPDNTIQTIHSIGYNTLINNFGKFNEIDNFKYKKICFDVTKTVLNNSNSKKLKLKFKDVLNQLEKTVLFLKYTLTPINDTIKIKDMMDHFGIEEFLPIKDSIQYIKIIIDNGDKIAANKKIIDFSDMIYLPYKWNLKLDKYDWILVDEAQDLNALQLKLISNMKDEKTRMIFVGDPKQAIYGFSGSDANSFFNIKNNINAKELPLSICYRCPKNIVNLAKTLVPIIEPSDNTIDGDVINIDENKVINEVQKNDLILCRTTAPLVKLCINLIKNKIPATVKGKDIGESLISIINHVKDVKNFNFKDFITHLSDYKDEKIENLNSKINNSELIENFLDQIECIKTIFLNYSNINSIEDINESIKTLFSDKKTIITLSTIHKAKGLEENRVFILNYNTLPMVRKKQKLWEYEQEKNLKYVAITRSKNTLYLVN